MHFLTFGQHFTVYKTVALSVDIVALLHQGLTICQALCLFFPICLIKSSHYLHKTEVDIIMAPPIPIGTLRFTKVKSTCYSSHSWSVTESGFELRSIKEPKPRLLATTPRASILEAGC